MTEAECKRVMDALLDHDWDEIQKKMETHGVDLDLAIDMQMAVNRARSKCPPRTEANWSEWRACPVCGALGPWFDSGGCISPTPPDLRNIAINKGETDD